MEELFGVSMNVYMVVFLAIFLVAMGVVGYMALRNPVMVKLGLRNIPRRRAQTVLIIVGIMLSSIITAAAFGTGDTVTFSIRNEAVKVLGPIDEIIFSARAGADDSFASNPYVPYQRFEELRDAMAGLDSIDGMTPGIGETVPTVNPTTLLSEGRMRVAGVDPGTLQGFGSLTLVSGGEVFLKDLALDQAYINEKASEELDAQAGHQLQAFLSDRTELFEVKGVVKRGGLAGDASTLIVSLPRAQQLFGRPGQINNIVVSNLGQEMSGARYSEEVTRALRVYFADRDTAHSLQALLSQPQVLQAIEQRQTRLSGPIAQDMLALGQELQQGVVSDQLISLLADEDISEEVLNSLEATQFQEVERQADTLFGDLGEFRVLDIKQQLLDQADEAGSFVTTFFVIMGLFSIIVGVLLIFLIFVMLAAARRTEMGMARAVGARRRHLVQMFLFEGTAYSLVSAAIGVGIGLGVSAIIVVLANRIFGDIEEGFNLAIHFEPRSVVVAYCLGMVIIFATVAISSYRVSRLNIVSAIRDLPTPVTVTVTRWREVLLAPVYAWVRPFQMVGRAVMALARIRPAQAWEHLSGAVVAVLRVPVVVMSTLFQLFWRPFTQGWLAVVLGVLITYAGTSSDEASGFRIGVSLVILGLGLMLRMVLRWTAMRAELRDRLVYTLIGVAMLVFWLLPFGVLRDLAGELEGGPEMFFISGVSVVAAAVWTVMYNSDLILRFLTYVTGRVGKLRPVVVTAVAYPMSAKFRTGLTLAMFALVIFTLIVMSILTTVFDASAVDQEVVTGGWDIQADVNFATPITDIHQAVANADGLSASDFQAIGGYTAIPIEARQVGAEDQRWRRYALRAADDGFLDNTRYKLKLIADGYGTTSAEAWQALRQDPTLAVVDAEVVPFRSRFDEGEVPFQMEGFFYEDDRMPVVDIEVREPRTGAVVPLRVIGVLDQLADSFGQLSFGVITAKSRLDQALPFPVPITTYRFRLAPGVDHEEEAKALEAAFRQHGVETDVLEQLVDEQASAQRAFNRLFTGFMGLGLLVGIAALGVISLRAVVERRQQIGVLRAIGYRRDMVQLSFLLEASFVSLLGVAIGVGLGSIMSYHIVNDVRQRESIESLRFAVPWLQVSIIIGVAYIFSLATTFLPARQAARIYPAEALRYE